MIGCLFAIFRFIWKIIKLALKIVWKVLRLLLFRFGLIFVGLYMLTTWIIELTVKDPPAGIWPGGAMQVWFYVGLILSILLTALVFIRNATKGSRKGKR